MQGKKEIIAKALHYTGAGRLLRAARTWSGVLVLNYHRIGDPHGCLFDRGVWSASAEGFDRQVGMLKRQFDVISPADLDRALLDRRGQYVMLTFEDGYLDNYELAFPVLKAHRVPATFFLTSGFLDRGTVAWWDDIAWMVRSSVRSRLQSTRWTNRVIEFDEPIREQAIYTLLSIYKQLPHEETDCFLDEIARLTGSDRCPKALDEPVWMSWEMVREMRRAGMAIGGHTVTHPILSRLPEARQRWEVAECKRRIEAELGEPIDAFSYPVGSLDSFDEATRRALDAAGYRWSFSFFGGFTRGAPQDPLTIPRMAVDHALTSERFTALLTWPQLFAG
ncbi:MAG: polysaccharide deacetylase family protein [Planctomycetaceae bacterium]